MSRKAIQTGRAIAERKFRPAFLFFVFLSAGQLGLAAQFDESSGIAHRRGDPSPSAADSNVNDYTYQDEQINISPDTGVVKVLRTDQKNLINDYVTDVIPIRNVTPREIRNLMRQICYAEGGRAEVILDKIKGQNFVQVICPRFQLPYIREAIKALDKPWVRALDDGAASVRYTARFRDIRAVDNLASVYAGDGESDLDLASNSVYRWDEPYRARMYRKGAETVDVPVNQVLLDLSIYEIAVTNDKKLGLDYIAWKNGPGRNLAGFVLAGMDNHERFTNLSSIYNPIFPRLWNPGLQDLRLVREFTADARYAYANYLLTTAYLDFLVSKGKAKVLVSTQLLARSGQGRCAGTEPAFFEAVEDVVATVARPNDPGVDRGLGARPTRLDTPCGVLAVDQNGDPIYDDDGNPAIASYGFHRTVGTAVHNRTLEMRMAGKVGVFFEVIPHVAQKSCELEIRAGVSSVVGYAPDGLPILAQRTLATQLVAHDGQPIVLTGLTRKTAIRNNARMPILGKIPILGYLAGGETDARRETQLAFVIKPTIITASESKIAMGRQAREAIALAKGTTKLKVPQNPLGFDQWLFDREAPAP